MVIPTADSPVESHDCCHRSVNLLCGFFLVSLDISGRVGANVDIVHVPPQNRVTAVGYFLFKNQFHQFLGGWGHILEALPERNDREAHALKVLDHLHGSPAVKGDLTNVEAFAQAFDELLDVAVMNNITLGGL